MEEDKKNSFMDSNIEEYVKRFGNANLFIKKIINSLNFPFSIINKNLEIEISNIKGIQPNAKCHKIYHNLDIPCDKHGEECPVQKVFKTKENVLMRADKKEKIHNKHHEIHAYPIFDRNGEVASVIKYDFDKKDLTSMEKKLYKINFIIKKLKRNYEKLYNNLDDAFSLNEMIYDKNQKAIDWKVLKANDKYRDIFKIKKKSIAGIPFSNIDPKMVSENIGYFDQALKNNRSQEKEIVIPSNKKKVNISVFKSEEKKFVNIIKEIEEESKGAEKQLCDLLQSSQDLVYKYNFKKDKFDYVSESVFTILGYSLEEFMKKNREDFNKIIHNDDIEKINNFGDDIEKEFSSTIEIRIKKKDGEYIWVRIKRAIFRDNNKKLSSCIGGMTDISKEKLIEKERKRLNEYLTQIRKKETKTKERIALTEKEKIVLWGLCRYPLLNDEELAEKIKLKRSTLTAIRNRLKQKKWFSLNYIPNFHKLGCQFISIFDTNLNKSKTIRNLELSLIKKHPEVILHNYQDDKFFGVFVSDKYVNFKKFLDEFIIDNRKTLKFGLNENSFFYDLDNIELRDSSEIINSLFYLERKEKAISYKFDKEKKELSTNEKRILHAIIKDPNMSSSEIAKKIWTSKPTVIKTKKKLLEENFIHPFIMPDFKKLELPYIGKLSFDFDSQIPTEIKNENKDPRMILKIIGRKNITKIILFASEEEYLEEVDLIRDAYLKSGIYFRLNSEIFPIQKRQSNNFNIEPLISEILFRDEI
ncbi:MAG: PAS domain-containing protein [Nanoarchaeota archaeon]|nr:PAS domain-containing protein [Nanoarchaeota archaeon]